MGRSHSRSRSTRIRDGRSDPSAEARMVFRRNTIGGTGGFILVDAANGIEIRWLAEEKGDDDGAGKSADAAGGWGWRDTPGHGYRDVPGGSGRQRGELLLGLPECQCEADLRRDEPGRVPRQRFEADTMRFMK